MKKIYIIIISIALMILMCTGILFLHTAHSSYETSPDTQENNTLITEFNSDDTFSQEDDFKSNLLSNESSSGNSIPNDAYDETITVPIKEETPMNLDSNNLNKETLNPALSFSSEPISDTLKAQINGLSYKEDCIVPYDDLRYLKVLYIDFNGDTQVGEIICNKSIAKDLIEIFQSLYEAKYQIEKIRLIDEYNADDDLSCEDNNTSCFNYRMIGGTNRLSNHAYGLAIDINPIYNPYVTYPNGVERISPKKSAPYGDRSADFPHKIDYNDLCYKLFTEHGFTWGGDWKSLKDYQHFEKGLD